MAQPVSGKHPQGLFVLFFTEMWERFSYYGMRALLVLYVVNALLKTDKYAQDVCMAATQALYGSRRYSAVTLQIVVGATGAVLSWAVS